MSLKKEQYRSLQMTKEFLIDLLSVEKRPKNRKEMRERVLRCLRHFPYLEKDGKPMFSNDDFY